MRDWQKYVLLLGLVVALYTWILVYINYYEKRKQQLPSGASIRRNAIRYIETANENRWGTFVDARDTLYIDGELFIFDTINLVYKRVATVTIHELK
jgi:hypothetical protein